MSSINQQASSGTLPVTGHRQAWALLRPHLRAQRGRLLLATLVTLAASACAMTPALAVGYLVDALAQRPGPEPVIAAVAAMVLGVLCAALCGWWARVQWAKVAEPAIAGLREEVVERALALEAGQTGPEGRGDLVSRVSDDARIVASAVADLLPTMVGAVTLLLVSVPAMFSLHWALGLVVLAAIPLYAASLRWYLPRSEPLYLTERERLGRRTGRLVGALHGQDALRAHGWSEGERLRIERASEQSRDAGIQVFRMLTGFFARNNRAECVTMVLLLIVGFFLVANGASSVGAVTAAALLFHRLFDPVSAVVVLFDVVQEAGVSLRRLAGVLTLAHREGTEHLEVAPLALSAVVEGHSYPLGERVLGRTRFTVRAGEVVALVGTTGAGKSTLAAIVAGTLTPSDGSATVLCAGRSQPLKHLTAPSLRRIVCLVDQRAHVFDGTLRQNLLLGVPAQRRGDADCLEALSRVGATWLGELPRGLDEAVGAEGRPLDPVQEQQIALARVMLIDPAFVVLDEATAEAGSAGARALDRAAQETLRGRGAVVVAHRLSQAREADRIAVMEHGRIVEEGPHDALVAAGGVYARLWSAWSGDASPR